MNSSDPDWSLWRSFSAVIAQGSLSGAARKLGLSQPTLGRHIEALEAALGVPLFERGLQGLKPNDTALKLHEPVGLAQKALAEAALIAEGTTGTLDGTVRITSSTVMCHYVLPPLLYDIRQAFPSIALELVPSDSVENLLLREADIAVRMFRPVQLDLITKKLGELPIICCGHQTYLAARGTPKSIEELTRHDLVGLDRSDVILQGARALGYELRREDFITRTDSQTAMWELMKAGLGLGFAQAHLVHKTPGMVALFPDFRVPPLEVWLTTHREMFTSRRIRAIYDQLAAGLTQFIGGLPS